MLGNESLLDRVQRRRARSRAAEAFSKHSIVHEIIGERMLERLELLRLDPRLVLDIYCAAGTLLQPLRSKFSKALVLSADSVHALVGAAATRKSWFGSRTLGICCELEKLPLAATTVDIVISNLSFCHSDDLDSVFTQLRTIIKTGGLVFFSSLGPDSFRELRAAWAAVDGGDHVHPQLDMHDIGDALIRSGFSAPVLDVEYLTVTYKTMSDLFADLRRTGSTNALSSRRRSLTGKERFQAMQNKYAEFRRDDLLPVTLEIVYGHAWVPVVGERAQDGSTVAAFPLSRLRETLTNRK